MALYRILLVAAAAVALTLPGWKQGAFGALELPSAQAKERKSKTSGWQDVPFTGTVTVKRTVNYEGPGDVANSHAEVTIDQTMVVRVTSSKTMRKAGGS